MLKNMIITALVFLIQSNFSKAQDGVNFKINSPFEDGMKSAQRENKLVFIDFYTTWCGPCKTMDAEVFINKGVADYMNATFVNMKFDAEQGEGVSLARKHKVRAYPTFIVLNKDGNEMYRMEGANGAELFLEKLKKGIDPKNQFSVIEGRYVGGERTPQLINDYAYALLSSNKQKEGFEVIDKYFESLSDESKTSLENMFLFERYTMNYSDSKFKYLLNNRSAFVTNSGEERINNLVYRFVRNELVPYANGFRRKNNTYESAAFEKLLSDIQKAKLTQDLSLNSLINIAKAQVDGNLQSIFNSIESEFSNLKKNDKILLMIIFNDFKNDRKLADRALALMDKFSHEISPQFLEVIGRVKFELVAKGEGIKFQNISFDEATKLAVKENKKIFLDCFTVWCGPCKWLDENTFKDVHLSAFFNNNYINLKIDMEKGEGVELAKRFNVKSYPTMLFISEKGEVLHQVIGAKDATSLMKETSKI